MTLAQALDRLEKHYGTLSPLGPGDAYEMLLYANCGYPASDITCLRGFLALQAQVGLAPRQILAAREPKLAAILRLGGILPELRATRLKQIASVVQDRYGGSLAAVLRKPLPEAKKLLKQFPTIGDPGAEKILLFTGTAPVPAVPAAFVHVLHRLGFGKEAKSYATGYRSAQEAIRTGTPEDCAARLRVYLLIQRHGRELCRRSRPMCRSCPLAPDCPYFAKQ